MHLTILIHHDGGEYWSEIDALPGCFASGRTLSELHESLAEAVGLYLWDERAEVQPEQLTVGAFEIEVRQRQEP